MEANRQDFVFIVFSEIKELVNKYHFQYIRISDDTFTWDRERTEQICNMFIDEYNDEIPWSCVTRTDKVDADLLRLMHRAGCFKVTTPLRGPGLENDVESGNKLGLIPAQ